MERRRNTISDKIGYDFKHFLSDKVEKSCFYVSMSLVVSSMNSSCAFSRTSSISTVNGLLASANGMSGNLGKYLEIYSSRICKCCLIEHILFFVSSSSYHFPRTRPVSSTSRKLYFHLIFFAKAEVSFGMHGSFLINLGMLHLVLEGIRSIHLISQRYQPSMLFF